MEVSIEKDSANEGSIDSIHGPVSILMLNHSGSDKGVPACVAGNVAGESVCGKAFLPEAVYTRLALTLGQGSLANGTTIFLHFPH